MSCTTFWPTYLTFLASLEPGGQEAASSTQSWCRLMAPVNPMPVTVDGVSSGMITGVWTPWTRDWYGIAQITQLVQML